MPDELASQIPLVKEMLNLLSINMYEIDGFEDAAKQEDADKEVANQASESIQVLASYTLKEAQIENLVTAKGYTDCVAFMGDDSLSIVVSTADGTLNSTDVAKITDIAMTETGYAASAIRIMASN